MSSIVTHRLLLIYSLFVLGYDVGHWFSSSMESHLIIWFICTVLARYLWVFRKKLITDYGTQDVRFSQHIRHSRNPFTTFLFLLFMAMSALIVGWNAGQSGLAYSSAVLFLNLSGGLTTLFLFLLFFRRYPLFLSKLE